jgi:hypothetical protein
LHLIHQQVGKVTQIAGMIHSARFYPFDALQGSPVPTLGFCRTTRPLSHDRESVTGDRGTRCIPDALIEGQALAIAAFGLLPPSLLLSNPAQLMPGNGLLSGIS